MKLKVFMDEGWIDKNKLAEDIELEPDQVEELVFDCYNNYIKLGLEGTNKYLEERASKVDRKKISKIKEERFKNRFNITFKKNFNVIIVRDAAIKGLDEKPNNFEQNLLIMTDKDGNDLVIDIDTKVVYDQLLTFGIGITQDSEIIELIHDQIIEEITLDEIIKIVLYNNYLFIEDKKHNTLVYSYIDKKVYYNNSMSNREFKDKGLTIFNKKSKHELNYNYLRYCIMKYNI